ncbi:MAG: ATP-binding cassette domain-containing protein [Candidatus Hydrogenedentota bacterium]|nr:MAG: ATP-binding cassette domain-containing protein [Candidatus Hydrogenedentota bacterium]
MRYEQVERVCVVPPRIQIRLFSFSGVTIYSDRRHRVPVLQRIVLGIEVGRVVLLHGPRGSGKSLFLRTLSGRWPHLSGDVKVMQFRIGPGRGIFRNRRLRKVVGYLPQTGGFLPERTLRENLLFRGRLLGLGEKRLKDDGVKEAAETFGLDLGSRRPLGAFSYREQRLAAVFLVTALPYPMLVLDEPFLGLAPAEGRLILQRILALREAGREIVVALSDPEKVEALEGIRLYIENGEVYRSVTEAGDGRGEIP